MSHLSLLKELQKTVHLGDGSSCIILPYNLEDLFIEQSGLSRKQAHIFSLENGVTPERYLRNQKQLTSKNQLALLASTVAVIGLGGLGGYVAEGLARAGAGTLILIDGDVIDVSNLNRQILATTENIGKKKVDEGKKRITQINPAIEVRAIPAFITEENIHSFLATSSIAIDCLDSISSRFILEKGCRSNQIPLVSAAVGGNSGQATVIYPEDPGFSAIYGSADSNTRKSLEQSMGTVPYIPMMLAAIQCAETISIICKQRPTLQKKLFFTTPDAMSFEVLPLTRD